MNNKIQYLRGFAICAVVAIHSNAPGILAVLDRPFLNFCVAMFIFCSGFLTKQKIENIGDFYKRRLLRIGIPYIIWSLVYTVPLIINHKFAFKTFLINILTGKCCGPFYFIFVYAQLVLLTPLISKLATSKYMKLGFIISPISIIITRYVCVLLNISLPFPFGSENVFNWFIFYYIGFLLGNEIITYRKNIKTTTVFYGVALVVSILEGVIWYNYGNFDMATSQIRLTSLATSVFAVLLSYIFITNSNLLLKENKFNKFMISLGNCSFGIYLSHMAVLTVLTQVPFVKNFVFPFMTIMVLLLSLLFVMIGRKILGAKISRKYLGL